MIIEFSIQHPEVFYLEVFIVTLSVAICIGRWLNSRKKQR